MKKKDEELIDHLLWLFGHKYVLYPEGEDLCDFEGRCKTGDAYFKCIKDVVEYLEKKNLRSYEIQEQE